MRVCKKFVLWLFLGRTTVRRRPGQPGACSQWRLFLSHVHPLITSKSCRMPRGSTATRPRAAEMSGARSPPTDRNLRIPTGFISLLATLVGCDAIRHLSTFATACASAPPAIAVSIATSTHNKLTMDSCAPASRRSSKSHSWQPSHYDYERHRSSTLGSCHCRKHPLDRDDQSVEMPSCSQRPVSVPA